MAYEMKEMKGALFVNQDKVTQSQPDYTGKFKLNGKEYRLAAWTTESRGGTEYFSLSITDPEEYNRSQGRAANTVAHAARAPGGSNRPAPALSDEEFERRRKELGMTRREQQFDDFPDDEIPF